MARKEKKTTYAMSRRRRCVILLLCMTAVAALVTLDHKLLSRKRQNNPASEEQVKNLDVQKYHGKTFTVVNVVDGDTIDIDIPDGQFDHTRIRLWGIDTPETKNPKTGIMYYGPQAGEFVTQKTLDKKVQIFLDIANRSRGKYGRLLAHVKLGNDRFLNEVLLSEGFAYADLRFRHSHYNKYKQLEAAARRQKKGLWQNVKREQLPRWLQRIKPNLLTKK